ncbi:MAG TPA: NADH-quinone oxidoreductase subunit N [Actinomycetota bacterium]
MPLDVDLHLISPEIVLSAGLMLILLVDLFLEDKRRWLGGLLSAVTLLGATAALLSLLPRLLDGPGSSTFGQMYVLDNFAFLFKLLFLVAGFVVVLISANYLNDGVRSTQGEFYFLLLASILGMMLMPSARDMLMLFVALELVSAPGFIVAGFRKRDPRSNEAAIKFFLFGVLSTSIMLFGMSLIYGLTGATGLTDIAAGLAGKGDDPVAFAAILFIIAGFGFKISAVPFHFWAPDTYEGAPVPVAAFLAVSSKAAGFAGLLQLMFVAFPAQANSWAPGLAILSALTMTVGNVLALAQTNIVRLLAYSSIAQAGYMLLPFGVVAGQGPEVMQNAFAASLTYILVYAFMNLGAFAVVIAVGRSKPANLISDYDGLGHRDPRLAVPLLFFLLALAGIPPLSGFWAKFFVFGSAADAGTTWLAAVMVINSVIGLYYYLSVGARMFLRAPPEGETGRFSVPPLVMASIVMMVIAVIAVGVYPELINHFSPNSTLVASP